MDRRTELTAKIKTVVKRLMPWEVQNIVEAVVELEDAHPAGNQRQMVDVILQDLQGKDITPMRAAHLAARLWDSGFRKTE